MSGDLRRDRRAPDKERTANPPGGPCGPRRVLSADLLKDARELIIEHAGQEYRLRVTAQGKLILTK